MDGWRRTATAGAVGSLLLVIALWITGGGLRNMIGAGEPALTLGRLTGLLASDLLLIQVLLMARIPGLERAWGHDTLARRHRLAGFASFWLMIAHVVLTTLGDAGYGSAGVVAEAWSLVTTYPGMLLATAGTALLVLVVVLSVRAARRRLRYESWHLLHLYAYLGIGLALPHQLWTGADFVSSAPARAYWWTMYLGVLATVVVFRVGLPLWRSAYHALRVHSVVPEAPGVVSVYLTGRRLDRLPVRAGQFFLWRFLDGPGWSRAHPYTLSAGPRPDRLRVTVKDLGDGSARVRGLRPGTRALVEGPYGVMTADRSTGRRPLLIAAGVGITTMRALLDDLGPAARGAILLYRVRDRSEAVFRAELDQLGHHHGVRVVYLEGHRPRRGSWLPADIGRDDLRVLRWLVPDVAERDVFLCGPPDWMAAVRDTLRSAGLPPERVNVEEFSW